MPAAMIAVVRKSECRVLLDPAFMDGDALTCQDGDEVRLLRMSQHGHMAEQASVVARMLRRAGWRVDVRDCEDLPPRPVRVLGRQPTEYSLTPDLLTRAALQAGTDLLDCIGDARRKRDDPTKTFHPPQTPPPPVENQPRKRGHQTHHEVCLTCGHATRKGPPIRSHITNLGHTEFQTTPAEDVPALQAQIRARAHQQACSPDGQEAFLDASDQRVRMVTHPERQASPEARPDEDSP